MELHAGAEIQVDMLKTTACALLILASAAALSAPPSPYTIKYDAKYRGLNADAEIGLEKQEDQYHLYSIVDLKLLGVTVSSINESSRFVWEENAAMPINYQYRQTGIGGRSRSIEFDWENQQALATVDEDSSVLTLSTPVLDELSMYTKIQQELARGTINIHFEVIDSDVIEAAHFRVLGEELVDTPQGSFNAVKLEKVRENSDRVTHYWFASELNYLLIKLYQREDNEEYEITMREAVLNGNPI